jgi:hypothetical protein
VFIIRTAGVILVALVSTTGLSSSSSNTYGGQQTGVPMDGEAIYKSQCAACHDAPATRAPDRTTLSLKSRDAILASLVSGTMSVVVKNLSAAEKRTVADYLGRPAAPGVPSGAGGVGLCSSTSPPPISSPDRSGLGGVAIWPIRDSKSRKMRACLPTMCPT